MCHARRLAADSLELLGMAQLELQSSAFGDVTGIQNPAADARVVEEVADDCLGAPPATIGTPPAKLEVTSRGRRFRQHSCEHACIFGVKNTGDRDGGLSLDA